MNVDAKKAIWAFDLHGVVLQPNYGEIAKILLTKTPFTRFIFYLFSPRFWHFLHYALTAQILKKSDFHIFKQDASWMESIVVEILVAQDIDMEILAFLRKQHSKNIPCYVLSNIWPESLEKLLKKFPEFNTLFNGFYIPDEKQQWYKPQKLFFEEFKKFVHMQEGPVSEIYFVDNGESNVRAAEQAGMHSFLLEDFKKKFISHS
jgi:FMN phosphatase YigB (HAD superfamily)